MITVNRIGDTITGSVNGVPFGVSFNEARYAAMLTFKKRADAADTMEDLKAIVEEFKPLTTESHKEFVEQGSPYLFVNKSTNQYHLRYNGAKTIDPLPASLVKKINLSLEKNIDILPLIKAWVRFMRNPKYTKAKAIKLGNYLAMPYVNAELSAKLQAEQGVVKEVADVLATTTQVAISDEGLIVGYKVSKEVDWKCEDDGNNGVKKVDRYGYVVDDITGLKTHTKPEYAEDRVFMPAIMGLGGDPFHCVNLSGEGSLGHKILVGCAHYLESWDQVNCNDGHSAVPGLHVGGLDYIRNFQGDGTVTHNVLIDPMHIGAIPDDYTGAMRVKQYFVHSSFCGVNKNIYHPSKYAAINDAEFKAMLAAVIKEHGEAENKDPQNVDHLASLI